MSLCPRDAFTEAFIGLKAALTWSVIGRYGRKLSKVVLCRVSAVLGRARPRPVVLAVLAVLVMTVLDRAWACSAVLGARRLGSGCSSFGGGRRARGVAGGLDCRSGFSSCALPHQQSDGSSRSRLDPTHRTGAKKGHDAVERCGREKDKRVS